MPRIVDHAERRSTIAAAAAGLIADDGIEAVTMKGIAQRAGVTTGAVTHYFADKDAVILAALLFVEAEMRRRLQAAVERGDPLIDVLCASLPIDADTRRDWQVWRVFTDAASRSAPLLQHYRSAETAWLQAAMQVIGEHLDPAFAERDVELIGAVVDGIGDTASADPDSWPPERQRALLQHCLARVAPSTTDQRAPAQARQ